MIGDAPCALPMPSALLLLLLFLHSAAILLSAPTAGGGCFPGGQPLCCSGRNMSCKAREERRARPLFSFSLPEDRVKEVRFGENCIGRVVLPDLVSLNRQGREIVRQLGGYKEHFRLYRSALQQPQRVRRSDGADWEGRDETVYQLGWEQDDWEDVWERLVLADNTWPIVRYSLLNRQLPLRIVKRRLRIPGLPRGRQLGADFGDFTAAEPWRVHFLTESSPDCFCDETCTSYGDCCTNYPAACPAVDCQVSGWSHWSECLPDGGASCGIGLRQRRRVEVRPKRNAGAQCPELVQRVGCFRQCAPTEMAAIGAGQVPPDVTTVALLLDYRFNQSRQVLPSALFRQQQKRRNRGIQPGQGEREYVKYCVKYRIEWLNRECEEQQWSEKLRTSRTICAECQPEAQFHRPRPRCASDLEDGQTGFWKVQPLLDQPNIFRSQLIGPKYCYGIWRRLSNSGTSPPAGNCECAAQFPQLHPFLLV